MAEPFKNAFNKKMITCMGDHFGRVWPTFDRANFVAMAMDGLEALELKERSGQIATALAAFLPEDFAQASRIMLESLTPDGCPDEDKHERGITGWGIMPMTHYVGVHGLVHFDLSMTLLKEMTSRFSSEFDIRFFLIAEEERTLAVLTTWLKESNQHVRRLVSEGTRPRLPWGIKLQSFIDDPTPLLPLLDALKDDDEEYVRRSVANNLNDIAKDNPDIVANIAKKWLENADKNRTRLVRHACRTLIKQGHQKTLEALGYGAPSVELKILNILTPCVKFGEVLVFHISISSTSDSDQDVIIDYAIHHRKANGRTSPKVFKWKTVTLKSGTTLTATKKHAIKNITTRTYHNGGHKIEILVNGVSIGNEMFELYDV